MTSRALKCIRRKRMVLCVFLFCLLSIFSFSAFAAQRGMVAVSILPHKYFVEQIAGDSIHVAVMVPPGANPATYEPRPSQMAELSKARIYFATGVPFEKAWLPRFKAANPGMLVVDTGEGIMRYPMSQDSRSQRDAKEKILDPHIWLSPPLVLIQARNILTALMKVYPSLAPRFMENYRKFCQKVAGLDVTIMKVLGTSRAKANVKAFMVFHPSWGYFARAYELKQVAIEQEGKEPKPSQLMALIKRVKESGIKVILVQPQFSTRAARIVAQATGARIVTADPLAYEWDKNLLVVAKELAAARD